MADLPRGFSGGSDLWDGPLGNSVFFEEFVTAEVPVLVEIPTYRGSSPITSLFKGVTSLLTLYKGTFPELVSDFPTIMGVTGATKNGGAQITLDALTPGSVSHFAFVGVGGTGNRTMVTPEGWTLVDFGSNSTDPSWNQYWFFVSNEAAPAELAFTLSDSIQSGTALVVNFAEPIDELINRAVNESNAGGDISIDSPSMPLFEPSLVLRVVSYNHISTSTATYPPSVTMNRTEDNDATNGVEKFKIAFAFEESPIGTVPDVTWALSGGDPWRPTAHTFAFTKA